MAKKTKGSSPGAGRDWLIAQLDAAETVLKHGPDGQGWRFNETKLPAAEEHAAFLRGLLGLFDSSQR